MRYRDTKSGMQIWDAGADTWRNMSAGEAEYHRIHMLSRIGQEPFVPPKRTAPKPIPFEICYDPQKRCYCLRTPGSYDSWAPVGDSPEEALAFAAFINERVKDLANG